MAFSSLSTPAFASASTTRAVAPTTVSSLLMDDFHVPSGLCWRMSQFFAFSIALLICSGCRSFSAEEAIGTAMS